VTGARLPAPAPRRRLPPRIRLLGHRLRSRYVLAATSLTVVLVIWELFGRTQPLFTSYPTAILGAAATGLVPNILPGFASTLAGYAVGLALSIPIAITLGVAMGRNRLVDTILSPYVNALYVTPRIALIPLLVLWFGLEFELRVAIVILSSVFPMIINTYAGMREVPDQLLDVGRVFMASGPQRLRTIVLPGSLPYIFTGLRLGVARALGGIIVAEMTASITGVGRLLLNYGRYFKIDALFVTIIAIGILGILLNSGLNLIQRLAAPWSRARAR
jgi:NitT/TauT family transport system permease protein